MPPSMPPLHERQQPGLSATLPFPRHPGHCQGCGRFDAAEALRRWIECDEWDRETRTVVVLCPACSTRLIDPHPRLYKPLERMEPRPATMPLCVSCTWREALTCTSPLLRANGGAGLEFTQATPTRAHLNFGRGRGRWLYVYAEWPTDCTGREPTPTDGDAP